MTTTRYPPCSLNITDQALSDLFDGVLADADAERLREYSATCDACRQRSAGFAAVQRALQAQRIPHLHARIQRDLPRRAQAARRSQPVLWGRVAGLATVALVIVLAVVSIHAGAHPTTSTATTTAITYPTVPPTPRPAHPLPPEDVWGTANAHTLAIDTTRYQIDDVLPNGAGVVGTTYGGTSQPVPPASPSGSFTPPTIVLISYPSLAVRTLYTVADAQFAVVATDGRYVVWTGGVNPTGGPGESHETIGYMDLQTGRVTTLYDAGDSASDFTAGNRYQLDSLRVMHGLLFLTPGSGPQGLSIFNLATGTQQTLFAHAPSTSRFTINWPYLLWINSVTQLISAKLVNLQTGQQTDIAKFISLEPTNSISAANDGTTLFIVEADAPYTNVGYYAIPHADQPGAQPQLLFTMTVTDNGLYVAGVSAADARLLFINTSFGGSAYAWDRVLHQLIAFPQTPTNVNAGSNIIFDNGVIGYWQDHNGAPELVLRDEATLPTA